MRQWLAATVVAAVLIVGASNARAQSTSSPQGLYQGAYSVYGAPGWHGVSYGSFSYGLGRKYTLFSSPLGSGYGYGYTPYTILPGPYGAGIWGGGGGASGPGSFSGFSAYQTHPVPFVNGVNSPPLGAYAPALGPSRGFPD